MQKRTSEMGFSANFESIHVLTFYFWKVFRRKFLFSISMSDVRDKDVWSLEKRPFKGPFAENRIKNTPEVMNFIEMLWTFCWILKKTKKKLPYRRKMSWKTHFWGPFLHTTPANAFVSPILMGTSLKNDKFLKKLKFVVYIILIVCVLHLFFLPLEFFYFIQDPTKVFSFK